ncbi:MAG: aminoglycoside phosphotransferase family protein [Parachlamydiaceae bacterium]|nr:aminoglycoside phosphotransferase family protein [Parachlamydiaceae bacterium]
MKLNRLLNFAWQPVVALCLLFSYPRQLAAVEGNAAILEQHNEAAIHAVLADEVPELNINSLKIISCGWDNLVADINGEWIFRFPRLEEFVSTLNREVLLLNQVHSCVSMPVPHYEYIGSRTAFVGYRKILGKALDKELYLSLSTEVQQQIADSLALFLSQLHQAVSVEEALAWGYKYYGLPLNWIESSLRNTNFSHDMNRIIQEAFAHIRQKQSNESHLVLLHNDLHSANFAFDVETNQVTGVFDFSDAAIGESYIEFGRLFSVDQDLVIRTAEAYARLSGSKSLVKSAAAETILRRVLYILYASECANTSREAQLLIKLESFVPIWDGICKRSKVL